MKPKLLKRSFLYAGTQLPDPNPKLSPDQCLKVFAAAGFPELINAKIEPPKIDGDVQTYELRVIAETKG